MSNNPWLQPEFWKGVVAQLIGLLALVGIIAQPDAQGLQDAGFKAVGGMGICIANAVMVIHYFRHRRQQQGMVEQTAGGLGGPPLVVLAVLCFCGSSPAFVAAQTWPGTGGRPGVVESRGPPPWQLQQPRQAGQANVVDVTVLVRAENRGGSAVVIGRVQSARGYEYLLSTAAHVTERARDVQLTWPGGTVLPGRVVSCNRQDDCALIAAASVQEFPTTRSRRQRPAAGPGCLAGRLSQRPPGHGQGHDSRHSWRPAPDHRGPEVGRQRRRLLQRQWAPGRRLDLLDLRRPRQLGDGLRPNGQRGPLRGAALRLAQLCRRRLPGLLSRRHLQPVPAAAAQQPQAAGPGPAARVRAAHGGAAGPGPGPGHPGRTEQDRSHPEQAGRPQDNARPGWSARAAGTGRTARSRRPRRRREQTRRARAAPVDTGEETATRNFRADPNPGRAGNSVERIVQWP